jgi:dTDP-glucose 4,6-dehydratase
MAVLAFQRTHGLPVIITRGSNTYGPRQFPEKLIPLMILSAIEGRDLPLYGDGANVRDWLHADDHAAGIAAALQGQPGEIYHLGSGQGTANIDLVSSLCDIIDAKQGAAAGTTRARIERVADRPGHDRRYALDCSKSASVLGWRPRIDIKQGLVDTIEWYLANTNWWRPIVATRYDLNRLGTGG